MSFFALLSTHLCDRVNLKIPHLQCTRSNFFETRSSRCPDVSPCNTLSIHFRRFLLSASARDWLNSNVNTCPLRTQHYYYYYYYPTTTICHRSHQRMRQTRAPGPAFQHDLPRLPINHCSAICDTYNICVRCANTFVKFTREQHQTNGF